MIDTTKMTPKYCFYNDPEVSGTDSQLKRDRPNITDEELKTILKQMWKDLPDEQRGKYEEMSRKAQTHTPPRETTQPLTRKVAKRAKNAYMQYITDPEVKRLALEKDSSLKGKTLNAQLAKQWRELSLEEKKPFEDRYQEEKANLLQNPILLDKPLTSRSQQTTTKPKRAKPAYFYYCHDPQVKDKLKQENPDLDYAGLQTKLGETWKTLTPEERQPYDDLHEKQKAELLKNPIMVAKTIETTTTPSTPNDTTHPQDLTKIQELESKVKSLYEIVAGLQKQVLENGELKKQVLENGEQMQEMKRVNEELRETIAGLQKQGLE